MKSPTRERKTNKRQNSTPHDLNPTFLSSIIITTQWFETNLNSNQFVNATIRTSVGVDISMGRRRRRKRVGGWVDWKEHYGATFKYFFFATIKRQTNSFIS